LDELLDSLRSDLRIELELERVAGKLTSCVLSLTRRRSDPSSFVTSLQHRLFNDHTVGLEYGWTVEVLTPDEGGGMRKATKQAASGKKTKAKLSDRSQALLERIRRRREQIRDRVGLLSDSSELIREERDRRF